MQMLVHWCTEAGGYASELAGGTALLLFRDPLAGLTALLACQRQMRDHDWDHELLVRSQLKKSLMIHVTCP